VVIERNSKTKKPDMKLDKAMMHTINKYLTDNNILEYICIDLVRVTSNRNWSIFCKYKANAKMLTHEKIKPPYIGSSKRCQDIIDIQEIDPWPRIKIYQISLDGYIPFRHSFNMAPWEIYKATKATLDVLQNIIEAEHGITLQHTRWIKSINHYIEEAQNNPNSKKYTTIIMQV
jgi:hypothetical protein